MGPPVNKYPQVLLEAHYEMGKKFFSNTNNYINYNDGLEM